MNLVREPDAGNPPVRFDEREVETEHGMRLLRHRRGNPDTELCRSLPNRATSRLYPELCPGIMPEPLMPRSPPLAASRSRRTKSSV